MIAAHHTGVVPPTRPRPGVDAVVRRGMAADPGERLVSAGEVARALAAAFPPASRPPSPAGAPPRRLRDPMPPTSGDWADPRWAARAPSTRTVLVALLAVLAVAVVAVVLAVT